MSEKKYKLKELIRQLRENGKIIEELAKGIRAGTGDHKDHD